MVLRGCPSMMLGVDLFGLAPAITLRDSRPAGHLPRRLTTASEPASPLLARINKTNLPWV